MVRKLFIIALVLCNIHVANAKDVSLQTAEKLARNFYIRNSSRAAEEVKLTLQIQEMAVPGVGRSADGRPIYYIFSVENNGGFVIVSGDDLAEPILGYSTEGNFSADNINPSMRKWLEHYREEILYIKENVTETSPEIVRLWETYLNGLNSDGPRSGSAVNPLCGAKWNQAPYENALCPFDYQYNERTVTGCVATAMAIIMKYWSYPQQGTGFHSYNHPKYGTLSANFGNTTYAWNSMPNVIMSNNNAVATIMYHCGVAVEMMYGPGSTGGSGAYVASAASPIQACAEYAFKTYFGYDPTTLQGVLRSNYTTTQWINLLKAELDAGRPIQYAGIGSGGGHTWVCDGYDNNNFFHMNWGWGGNSDGYFNLNNLNPQTLGAGGGTGGFNGNQHALIGIKPKSGGGGGGGGGIINQSGIQLYGATTVNANPFQSGGNLEVYAVIANTGTQNFTGDFACALFNSEGVFVDFIQEYINVTALAGYYYNVTFAKQTLSLIPGTYYIGLYYKNGNNNYSLIDPGPYYNPVSITVTGPYNNIQMYSSTTVNPSQPIVNKPFTVQTQIANAGSNFNFSGFLAADIFDMEGNYMANIQDLSGVILPSGYYNTYQFSSQGVNIPPGTYYVAFFSSTDGQYWNLVYNNNHPNPVLVTFVSAPLNPDQYEANNSATSAYNFTVSFSGNSAAVQTTGANIHVGNDYDYFKINLPAGYNYTISARVHDSYNSGNGQTYTNDVQFSYQTNGGNWSDPYDDIMPGPFTLYNGGNVIFWISNYFTGTTGTYLLDVNIQRSPTTALADEESELLQIYPVPANNILNVNLPNSATNSNLQITDLQGRIVKEMHIGNSIGSLQCELGDVIPGVYVIQITSPSFVAKRKFIVE
ncbi:MAG: thiol protease/hemagglutinin PrtT [Chitinophagales bacterium]|nr:thiol protease/hemagglutinin PrtT [Chitinophagales bacterium]MDW8418574.1 C10 family peptidase [Chitinophagales bacterium]